MDNLLLEIQTDDVYEDVEDSKHFYDTSGFPKDHPLHSATNKKVLGKMKDEMNGTPTAECVCLGPKIYSIQAEKQNIKKSKGAEKNVVKKEIRHVHYKEMLFCKKPQTEHASHRRAWDLLGAGEQNLSDLQNLSLIQSDISQKTE